MIRVAAVLFALLLAPSLAVAADSPVGTWKTIDDKTGKALSEIQIYEQDSKLFGKIVALSEPNGPHGNPKICIKCPGADKDKPILGLVIIRDLAQSGTSYKGSIMDPEDGKIYKAELWVEDGKLRVRGYLGFFYRTQTWIKA